MNTHCVSTTNISGTKTRNFAVNKKPLVHNAYIPPQQVAIPATMEEVPGWGAKLAQTRQAKGLSQTALAQQLRLNVGIIQALEQEQYEKLPNLTFTRIYVKKYAHILGIAEHEILSLVKQMPACSPPLQAFNSTPRREINSGNIFVKIITWSIVVSLITLVSLWWRNRFVWEDVGSNHTGAMELETSIVYPDRSPLAPNTSAGAATGTSDNTMPAIIPEMPSKQNEPPTAIPPNLESIPNLKTKPKVLPPPIPLLLESDQAVVQTTTKTQPFNPTTASTASAKPQLSSQHKVVLAFSGSCWVDIRDSTNTYKLSGKMRKGDKKIFEGTPPYKIILGNSSSAALTVNGKSIDLTSHSHRGIVRLNLDPAVMSGQP